jgi:hypothetical protein
LVLHDPEAQRDSPVAHKVAKLERSLNGALARDLKPDSMSAFALGWFVCFAGKLFLQFPVDDSLIFLLLSALLLFVRLFVGALVCYVLFA